MVADDIKRLLKKAPFKPFTLVMSNGERHHVYHPEMLVISQTVFALAVIHRSIDPNAELPIADYIIWLDLAHVNKVEPLEPARTQ